MSALHWWRHYDKQGRPTHTATIRATGQKLDIHHLDGINSRFVVDLDGHELRIIDTLTAGKEFAQRTADNLSRSARARAVQAGTQPPELF